MPSINAVWEHGYRDDCIPNFSNNMELPRHGWYDFKEGFSSSLVDRAIRETRQNGNKVEISLLDPFSGSGTSPLSALQNGCNAIGFEVNPFMSFVGRTKCTRQKGSVDAYKKELDMILSQSPFAIESPLEGYSTFTPSDNNNDKWLFNTSVIRAFEALYSHISKVENSDFFLLALISAAMQCCNAKKDGKCLRYIKGWENLQHDAESLRACFKKRALTMISDLRANPLRRGKRRVSQGDTRTLLKKIEDQSIDLVIFSPPYLNSFDYSDIYRPELFLGKFVASNDDLMKIRKQTLRSHVQCKWDNMESSKSVWVRNLTGRLLERKDKLWNDDIPQMVSSYFYDMEIILKESYRIANRGAQLWFVVSTSAYGGIEIPVDLILADIAEKQGWDLTSVNALRKLRTSSQCIDDNKQRVRLRESLIICRK